MTDRPGTDRPIQIAPSVLPADFSRLGDAITELAAAGSDRIHWDVMDGVFVPNFTIGPGVIASCRDRTDILFEAHLMVADPDPLLADWIGAGCGLIIVHEETCAHLHRTLGRIRDLGAGAAVVLNPATPASAIENVLDLCDMVLVMSVNPGFGGQSYIATMEHKVATIRRWILERGLDCDIEIDGGIAPGMVSAPVGAGANVLVSGSSLFKDPAGLAHAVDELRARAEEAAA